MVDTVSEVAGSNPVHALTSHNFSQKGTGTVIGLGLCLRAGDGNSKMSSVYINNSHVVDDDDFYDRNLALFEVRAPS